MCSLCSDPISLQYHGQEPDGECPDCGTDTIDGRAIIGCGLSPIHCHTCMHAPCDASCE